MDFNWNMPVRVISGQGAVRRSGALLRELGDACLVVTGGTGAEKSGALEDMRAVLAQAGIAYQLYQSIGQNPLVSCCDEAGRLAHASGARFIVGIGGGSAMDAAKAAAIYAANPGLSGDMIYTYNPEWMHTPLPVVLVGTTAGTGSEVSAVSVLTKESDGRKKSISGQHCFARLAFADPAYTYTVPYAVTVSTALDALSHTVEGLLNPNAGELVRLFGNRALELLVPALCRLAAEQTLPDTRERDRLYYGSLYAGVVLSACGTAFPHPMGYVLTEDFAVPHGRACAAFLPALMEYACLTAPRTAQEVLGRMQMDLQAFCSLVHTLADVHVCMAPEQAEQYAARWVNLKNFKNVPGGYDETQALALLQRLFVR